MCGIAGILSPLPKPDRQRSLSAMLDAARHRGPDGSGIVEDGPCALGHVRLAVIDTSAEAAQPMSLHGVHISYNGELYNFQDKRMELEEEGVTFRSSSDTEVLLHLYLKYGENCLAHLRGIYAFAIWNCRNRTLFCARDPLGVKPFLYYHRNETFIFASELKALLASGLVEKRINRQALGMLLSRGSVPQPHTILTDVKWLLPGHSLTLRENGSLSIREFRPLHSFYRPVHRSYAESLVEADALLKDIIRRQTVSDVPIGAFLSGGVDSSLLTALMLKERGDVRTFSVGFEGELKTSAPDETKEAAEVAAYLGTRHTSVIIRQEDVRDSLPSVVTGLDHPTVDGVNSWFVARAAAQDLRVAISGTGGDELFGGYPWFSAMAAYSRLSLPKRLKLRLHGESFDSLYDSQYFIFTRGQTQALCAQPFLSTQRPDPLRKAGWLNRVSGRLLSGYTRDQLLADIDAAAMHHSLEVRVPLLDEELLRFALSLPDTFKLGRPDASFPAGSYAASGVKRLLTDLARPLLPQDFALRGKKGFSLPFDDWLKGILSDQMHDLLSPASVSRRGLLDAAAVSEVLSGFASGTAHWTQPWLLMTVELWCRNVLEDHYA